MALTVRWNERQTRDLSHSVCAKNQTKTTLKRHHRTNKQSTHESSVGLLVRVHMLHVCVHIEHVVVLVVLRIRVIQSSSMFPYVDFSLVCEFFVIVHTAKTGLLRCCLHTPWRWQQTAVSCKRSICNKIENNKINSWKPFVWGFTQRSNTTGCTILSHRFACILFHLFSLNSQEDHQDPLHCHQVEEELDDGCRSWYFQ